MKDEILNYLLRFFSIDQITIRDAGSIEFSSTSFFVYIKNVELEIVVYHQRGQIGVSINDEDTMPFTGHDEVFDHADDAIRFVENYMQGKNNAPMQTINYYTGFEGEPEIRMLQETVHGKIITELKLWEGYFDALISKIPTNSAGHWEGVSLQYHLHTGWYTDEKWLCNDKQQFLDQLISVQNSTALEKETQAILNSLIALLHESIANDTQVYLLRC